MAKRVDLWVRFPDAEGRDADWQHVQSFRDIETADEDGQDLVRSAREQMRQMLIYHVCYVDECPPGMRRKAINLSGQGQLF